MDAMPNYVKVGRIKKEVYAISLVLFLICLAVLFRQVWQNTENVLLGMVAGILRSLIYFGLFIAWGLSVRRRVMQKQVRTYLTIISGLMVFWLSLRTIKYFFVDEGLSLFRYLWYSYYIPNLLIVQISFFIALSMGKPEDYRFPKWIYIFYIPSLTLISLVLTNDYHELVFKFSGGILRNKIDYKHNFVFYIIFVWIGICALITIITMVLKSKESNKGIKVWLPFIPFVLAIAYTFMYIKWVPIVRIYANDMTIVNCLLIISIFESSIYIGLIRSNRHYGRLFYSSSISGLITDKEYKVYYKSKIAQDLSLGIMKLTEKGSIELDESTRLSGFPIRAGHILWQEDVSKINNLLIKLKEVGERLAENNDLLEAERELKQRQAALDEKDRLYITIINGIDFQLKMLDSLFNKETCNKEELKEKLNIFYIIGAYIKRRSNLVILTMDEKYIGSKEIEYCFRESVEALSESGIDTFFKRKCQGKVLSSSALMTYDIFQEILELSLNYLKAIFINLKIQENHIDLKLQIEINEKISIRDKLKNLNKMEKMGAKTREKWEDNTLYIELEIPGGGVIDE